MSQIEINDLKIDFPENPNKSWNCNGRDWEEYLVPAYLEGVQVGNLTISRDVTRKLKKKRLNDFWFNLERLPEIVRRPVVCYQETEQPFRGRGISGMIIILANSVSKERFGDSLSSDTLFVHNPEPDFTNLNYSPRPAKRVWEKLEEQGLAYLKPVVGRNRWIMK